MKQIKKIKTITYKIKCNHTIGKIHPIDEYGMYCEFENRYLREKELAKLFKKMDKNTKPII